MVKLVNWLSLLGLAAALGSVAGALGSGLGTRFGWWHYRTGIATLGTVFWVACGAAVACALAIVLAMIVSRSRRALVIGLIGLVLAGVTAWVPYNLRMTARAVPPIHDISTDLENPPLFVRVAALRSSEDHPVAYDGPAVAEMQRKGYPDLAPLTVSMPPARAFVAARAALESLGLEVVDADAGQGRLEAVATSMLFGFRDDVVVRLTPQGGATRVDVRSKSRVGRNDFGQNAGRVRAILDKVKSAAG